MNKKIIRKFKASLIGFATGFVNGFFGAGSGQLCVPALKEIMDTEEKKSHATTIMAVFFASLVSAFIYFNQGKINFSSALPYMLGGIIGGPLGAFCLGKIKVKLLNFIFALFLIYSALRMLFS